MSQISTIQHVDNIKNIGAFYILYFVLNISNPVYFTLEAYLSSEWSHFMGSVVSRVVATVQIQTMSSSLQTRGWVLEGKTRNSKHHLALTLKTGSLSKEFLECSALPLSISLLDSKVHFTVPWHLIRQSWKVHTDLSFSIPLLTLYWPKSLFGFSHNILWAVLCCA